MSAPTLFTYLQDTQTLLRETKQTEIDPGDLIRWINRARREIAMRSQSVRVLTPISGAIISASVTSGGSGYSNSPTVTVTPPDFPSGTGLNPGGVQATATATASAGTISAVSVSFGGAGYFQPSLTITDATGTGAKATPKLSFINQLQANREVYNFSDIDLSQFPGVDAVYAVKSISVLFSNYRYSLAVPSFSSYQSCVRTYPFGFTYTPVCAAQFGSGTNGSLFVYPIPSQAYQFELDCLCLPQDLIDDQSVEVLPQPWTDSVVFYACHFGMMSLMNFNAGRMYLELFNEFVNRNSTAARPGRRPAPYGRPFWG
jgi:hypothetical protein